MFKFSLIFICIFYIHGCKREEVRKPNFIIIFADDLGYGDLHTYGNPKNCTPNIDQMAAEGMLFTSYYASSSVCTPSRASLLTGCYPKRIGMDVSSEPVGTPGRQVLYPLAKKGLNPTEVTIADALKTQGYATACIGKWHLGDQPEFMPTEQGFDYFYGIPYSNDMDMEDCPLPLMRNQKVIEAPVRQDDLTRQFTEETITFIQAKKDNPFFIYLPHVMVHAPLQASKEFKDRSGHGIYTDAVEELDWSTGEILDYLKSSGLSDNTMVVFISDNGASKHFDGTNAPLEGHKATSWEGGFRVPSIFWWPGHILQGSKTDALSSTLDLLPTLCHLSGAPLPNAKIDGKNIWELLDSKTTESPNDYLYYYQSDQLMALRNDKWKLHLPLDKAYDDAYLGTFLENRPMALYNMKEDIGEQNDVSSEYQEVVNKLLAEAELAREDLGDLNRNGENTRPAGIAIDVPVCNQLAD